MLQATVVHDQHDQINAFDANLQTPAAAAHGNECGSAPAIGGAAGGHAASVLAANNEAAFDQVRYDDHALGVAQHFFRNALIGGCHNRLQNLNRIVQAVNSLFPV